MARPKRFELLTPRFVVWCSIHLSYERVAGSRNPEGNTTPCLLAAADDRSALAMPRRPFRNVVGAASDNLTCGAPFRDFAGATSDDFMICGCAGWDGGSQVIKNEMLIERAHGESAERKLDEMY